MRTLRQIPKTVGRTDAGQTIYEVRSARLVLLADAAHFNRLVLCSKCGREVPGRAVLGPADLDRPPQAVVCTSCGEVATEVKPELETAEPLDEFDEAPAEAEAEADVVPDAVPVPEEKARPALVPQSVAEATAFHQGVAPAPENDILAEEQPPPPAVAPVESLDGAPDLAAGTAGDAAEADDARLSEVERKVDDIAAKLGQALEAQRKEVREALREGLADVLSTIPSPPPAAEDNERRMRALARQIDQSRGEVSELNELHAALDAGLGVLRAELGEVRSALGRLADSNDDLDDRLETFVRMSLVSEGDKGRRAKKAAGSTLATLSAAVQDLLREQRQLKDTVAGLQQASDSATAGAARASMQASSLGSLRAEVKLLHQELVEQREALDELRRALERLPDAPDPRPVQRSVAKTTKTTKTTKASAPTPANGPGAKKAVSPKAATAKAALARAAAAQAAEARPVAKRASRVKKG